MKRIIYIHGRPSGHPIHDAYAKSIDAKFLAEDYILPWLQENDQRKIIRYTSWILCALFFPSKLKNNVLFCEGMRVPPLLVKKLFFFNQKQQLIALMADESLYLTASNKYPKLTMFLMKQFFANCDYLVCIGPLQKELAQRILPDNKHYKIKEIFNGLSTENLLKLKSIEIDYSSKNILFIGHIGAEFRYFYKGMDVMVKAFEKLYEKDQTFTFTLVGEIDQSIQNLIKSSITDSCFKNIIFTGKTTVSLQIKNAGLCLHAARGDAFPTSTLETMAAALPTMVSDLTGTKEICRKTHPNLVSSLEIDELTGSLEWYFNLSINEKKDIGQKAQVFIQDYTEEKSLNEFKKLLKSIILK